MKLTSTKRPKKQKLAASYTPHCAAILAVDTAQVSGWALFVEGVLVDSGELNMLRESPLAVCRKAQEQGLPAVLVYERPFRGTTQGQFIGNFKAAWIAAGGRVRAMLGCYPATWMARVLGSPCMPRDVGREVAMRVALQQLNGAPCGYDQAAAIGIGLWSSRAGEVGKVLPKRAPKLAKTG